MAVTRRDMLKATAASVPLAAFGTLGVSTDAAAAQEAAALQACREFMLGPGGRKPVVLPAAGSTDPAAHSRSDVLFWSEQMMEHAVFLAMLLPGDEAADLRQQALQFRTTFEQHLNRVQRASIDRDNYRDVNRTSGELVKPLVEFKLRLEEALRTGQIRGLVYPTFAAHIAAEGEHFLGRLEQLSRGQPDFDLAELVPFWARIMGEHALFTAHLLDPREAGLIAQAQSMAASFQVLGSSGDAAALAAAGELILTFKETAEAGIEAGQIQSIIHPALADHVRREAIKFRDEIARAMGADATGPSPLPVRGPAPAQVPGPGPR